MLILSRETVVRIARHAWHVYSQEAFGYLLGAPDGASIHAALPCSRTHDWQTRAGRWNGIERHLPAAEATAAQFELAVVGLYRSCCADSYPLSSERPDPLRSISRLLLVYRPHCCKSCSYHALFRGDTPLDPRSDYAVPAGRRADPQLNGRRIHQDWRRRFGPIDYDNHDTS